MASLEAVFGISITPVLSYVERPEVDGAFVRAIGGHHHLVIYGASKQGKTALRQKHVPEASCIVYRCNLKSATSIMYQSILKDAGIHIEVTETKSEGTKGGARGSWSFKAMIPCFGGADASGEISGEASRDSEKTVEYVEADFGDSQMVGSLLTEAGFDKLIIVENFHYLDRTVQQQVAIDLKTFHELGIRFVILGVWRESNLLFVHNPDLQGRVAEIPVEPWDDADFDNAINTGAKQLNIIIPDSARLEFKSNAYGNVGLLQEFLKTYCRLNGVKETLRERKTLDATDSIPKTLASNAEDQRGRLLSVLDGISSKSRAEKRPDREDPLTLPYYLAQVLLTASIDELRDGMTRQHLLEQIRALHRRENKNSIRMNDVVYLLKRLPFLQADNPSPFLYESNGKLRIADAGLFFALAKVNRQELREEVLDPLEVYESYEESDSESPD